MAENNTSNTSSATPTAAGAKHKYFIPVAVLLVLCIVFLALFYGSVSLYRKAAENGDKEAQFALGMHYRYGLGVEKDMVMAWDLWRKAAEQGLESAKNKLTEIHKDIEGAAKVENADPRVQLIWGSCLANGWGPKANESLALEWFRKAAEKGNADAKAIVDRKEQEEAKKQQELKEAEAKKQAEEQKKQEQSQTAAAGDSAEKPEANSETGDEKPAEAPEAAPAAVPAV